MPATSADRDKERERERRRRPTVDDRRDRDRSHSREPKSSSSSSRDRDRDRSHSQEPKSSSHRTESRDRERSHSRDPKSSSHRTEAGERRHRSPSREKHAAAAPTASRKRPHARYALPTDAAALAAAASRSGFLRKQADNEPGAWNRYFFLIKPSSTLYYFNAEDDEAPRGAIDLEFLTDVKRNSDCLQRAVGGSEHCFRLSGKLPPNVRDKMRPLYLDAESADDARAWMEALREHRFTLARHEATAANEAKLGETERALAKLQTERAKTEADARQTATVANRVLDRLRRMALSNEDLTEDPLGDSTSTVEDDERIDLLSSLQAMESVVSELHLKMAAQQQTIGAMREQIAEQERKQREKALKFVASKFKTAAANRQNRSMTTAIGGTVSAPKQSPVNNKQQPVLESESEDEGDGNLYTSTTSSITSDADNGSATTRPKSASNAMALFTRTKNLATRSKAKQKASGTIQEDGDDSPNTSTVGSYAADNEESSQTASSGSGRLPMRLRRNTATEAPGGKKTGSGSSTGPPASSGGGLVSALKKRVTKTTTTNFHDSSSSSSTRGSEEDAMSTASADDRTSVESGATASSKAKIKKSGSGKSSKEDGEKLPKGWTKHQSRSNPGQFFYAHTSGATSWKVPTEDPDSSSTTVNSSNNQEDEGEESDASEDADDGKASSASASTGAAKPKKKKGWAFKLPRKLTISTAPPAAAPAPSASPQSASTSPIEHDESHHEF